MTGAASHHPTVLLEDFRPGEPGRSFRFDGLERMVTADSADEVMPALRAVEEAVAAGRHAAGFVSYEAAAGLNPLLAVKERDPSGLPLVWFGIFSKRVECTAERDSFSAGEFSITTPQMEIERTEYVSAIDTIRQAIARGETYQVNFTVGQDFYCNGDLFGLYRAICRNQRAPYCAWLDMGSHRIMSASPELFFSLEQDRLTMRPMKGTAPRLPLSANDLEQKKKLAANPKERAENLMIVDLVRNDLSMIAETGSVTVPTLFDLETYPTLHQMTSTVTASVKPETGLADIFRALFPCGSVTGAPKRRTMEIIREQETGPRGVYCGAIGHVSPGNKAVFSVAIRTIVAEAATGKARLGIGSGITWDSDPQAEYRECLTKGSFLQRDSSPFGLIESIRCDRDGLLLLERHLARLAGSAAYFGFACDLASIRRELAEVASRLDTPHKVRLLLAENGAVTVAAEALLPRAPAAGPAPVAIAEFRTDSSDPFLYHKTTRRERYDQARRQQPECYDVLFLNERQEATEGSFNNIVAAIGGELFTPALCCGLMPGVLRTELLEAGAMREAILTLDDLLAADTIWLINSVRGWVECRL